MTEFLIYETMGKTGIVYCAVFDDKKLPALPNGIWQFKLKIPNDGMGRIGFNDAAAVQAIGQQGYYAFSMQTQVQTITNP